MDLLVEQLISTPEVRNSNLVIGIFICAVGCIEKTWSSGYGRRLMFQRSWVQIPAPYTGWTFFTFICCKNCIVCLKRPKINEKEAGVGPLKKESTNVPIFFTLSLSMLNKQKWNLLFLDDYLHLLLWFHFNYQAQVNEQKRFFYLDICSFFVSFAKCHERRSYSSFLSGQGRSPTW